MKEEIITRYSGKVLFSLMLVGLLFSVFGAGQEPPPIQGPKALNLTANPQSIYLGGETSIITATVYSNPNYTEPMPYIYVYFNTSLGSLTPLSSSGGYLPPDTWWVATNQSGMALVKLTSGLIAGNATVCAWVTTPETTLVKWLVVEVRMPEYGVALRVDNQTKVTGWNENVTYFLEVKNIGTGTDSYVLTVTTSGAEFAGLNKTVVNLTSNKSEVVALTVSSYLAGSYNVTVEAVGIHSRANLTVMTIVTPFYNLSLNVSPRGPQTVAPGVTARYTLTLKNQGNANDRVHVTKITPTGVTATLSKDVSGLLSPNQSEEVVLNVSSGYEGIFIVNVTAVSEGNASVNATAAIEIVVTREGFEFDTGTGTYPSIAGVHRGMIMPNHTVIVKRLSTYPAAGTGGHATFVELSNETWRINATWNGYRDDYQDITFPEIFWLFAGQAYQYEIRTGSYPQAIHKQNHRTLDGSFINCTSFEDVNGESHSDCIPAFRLYP
jgi:hypothetical protein